MAYLKAELSYKNKYRLSKHRMYELQHFCLQYPDWVEEYKILELRLTPTLGHEHTMGDKMERPVEELLIRKEQLNCVIQLVESCAKMTDECIGKWILKAVTEGLSFPQMKMRYGVPCEKDMWYDRYRKFFWLLSARKGLC